MSSLVIELTVIALNPKINILEISKRLQKKLKEKKIFLRQSLNCGKVLPINKGRDAIGDPINICQRIMDCGDANHILASDHFVATKIGRRPPYENFYELGIVTVKHNEKVKILNYDASLYSLGTDLIESSDMLITCGKVNYGKNNPSSKNTLTISTK